MSQVCQKCGKGYEPKRRGGKFCSVSCRVTLHQRARRRGQWVNPNTGDESYLAGKLHAVGRTAVEALAKVQDLPAERALAELRAVVQAWTGNLNNGIIERILANDAHERTTDYEAYRQRSGLY